MRPVSSFYGLLLCPQLLYLSYSGKKISEIGEDVQKK